MVLNAVFLAHGVIATSDWQYRDQRMALSRPAIDVLYNREQYYLFINRCPWPILLTWYAIKFQSKKRIIYAILFPLHPNQPSDRMYMFFTSTLQSFLVHKTSSCHSPHPTSMLICHFYNFQTTTRMTKNDLKQLKTTEYSHNYDLTRICLELFLEQKYQCYCRISEL